MSTSPMSQNPPPFYPRHSARSLPSSRPHSRSSSVESRPRGRTLYSHNRSPSQDSLYLSMDSSCGPIQRWDGLAREATEWNSLRRDPELYLPVGNCLVFLYAAGSSQRGPSFRIPYDLLLYSGCRPLIERCLVTSSTSEYHPASSTPPSYDAVDYPMSLEENCCFLYLQAPAGLSRDESYVYHLTTRNFFAWLLGVPLVGTDPISALLDLKIRMDTWRDPGSGNFGALFDYVKEQGYGDFEALEIEMGKRLNADMQQAIGPIGFPATSPMVFSDQSSPTDQGKTSRRNSLTQRIRRKLSRSRTRENEPPASTIQRPNNAETRLQTLMMNNYTPDPPPSSADHISAAMQRLVGPPSTQSVDTLPSVQNGKEEQTKKRRSWTNIAGSAWRRASMTDVRSPTLQTQRPQPVVSPAVAGPYLPESVPAQAVSPERPAAPAEKKNRRLSWKRDSVTDIKLPPLPTPQTQAAVPSTTFRPPSAPAPASAQSLQSAPAVGSVLGEGKKQKRRLSWANVSDKIFDMMMPPMSKDDLPVPGPASQGNEASATNKPAELPATEVAAAASSSSSASAPASSSAAAALPATEAKPSSTPSAAGSATRSSSRHPSIHDFSTGKEICACCGKTRQPRPESSAAPSRHTATEVTETTKNRPEAKGGRGAFETLHDHMKARRNKFRSQSHREIIIPDYGNGTRALTSSAGEGKNPSTDADVSPVKTGADSKGRKANARKMKTRAVDAAVDAAEPRGAQVRSVGSPMSIDAIVGPTEARTKDLKRLNAIPSGAVVSSLKLRPEKSAAMSAGPMLATELVASPTNLPELSASPSSPDASSLRDYRRSPRPASLDYGRQSVVGLGPGATKADDGRVAIDDTNDIPHRVTAAGGLDTSSTQGSGNAGPGAARRIQGQGAEEEERFRVVDADFESNIEDLLAQLEAAGISEKKTERGKDKQNSLLEVDPSVGMPRLVHEVA